MTIETVHAHLPPFQFSAFQGKIFGWDGEGYRPMSIWHAKDELAHLMAEANAANMAGREAKKTAQAAIALTIAINQYSAHVVEMMRRHQAMKPR